jgi:hypothetical protein
MSHLLRARSRQRISSHSLWLTAIATVVLFVAVPATASATVSPLLTDFGTSSSLNQFNMGAQTSGANARIALDSTRAYNSGYAAKASYAGGGTNGYARGVQSVDWNDGTHVWYGEAVYLPTGFKAAMQGQVDLMRWDNYSLANVSDDWGGISIWHSDKLARLLLFNAAGDTATLVGPFNIPEGRWNWIEVHQIFSSHSGSAYSAVYLNGSLVGTSTLANKYALGITRIRFGLVAIAENSQTNPLSLWFDRAYIGTSQLSIRNRGARRRRSRLRIAHHSGRVDQLTVESGVLGGRPRRRVLAHYARSRRLA